MWGKDELNLNLTFIIAAGFFRNLEVLNPGIKSVKNIWNLKQVWITPKSLSHFSCYLSGVYKNVFMRNDISNIILQDISVFFDMMLSFNQVIFLGICIHSQLLYVFLFSFRRNEYFWIVGSIKHWIKSHCGIDGFGL